MTFTKFSFAGFDVKFENPNVLTLSIWMAFAYFLYRYYQYFSDEGIEKLYKTFEAALEKKCEPIIEAIVKSKYPKNNDACRYSYGLLKLSKWKYNGHELDVDYDPSTGTIVRDPYFEIPITKLDLKSGFITAALDTIFRNSVITDYLLPFALAFYVLAYCGSDNWPGSFFRLLLH